MSFEVVFKSGSQRNQRVKCERHAVVGSSSDADIAIPDDPLLDRRHFCLEEINDQLVMRDLGSRHGTTVNQQRVSEARVHHGDLIQAGLSVLEVMRDDPHAGESQQSHPALRADDSRDERSSGPVSPSASVPEAVSLVDLACELQAHGLKLVRELGQGGMGTVYLAKREGDGRLMAVKYLDSVPAQSPERLKLFLREIEVHGQLDHPHIVRYEHIGNVKDEIAWFAMEFVEGLDLQGLVSRAGGGLSESDACSIVLQLVSALEYAHNLPPPDGPFIHRDVKPRNILVSGQPGQHTVKLTDFGIAKNYAMAGFSNMTVTGQSRGTLAYMSPAQIADSKYVGPEADLFAVGAVMYYCLCGTHMYPKSPDARPTELLRSILTRRIVPIQKRRSDVPRLLQTFIERCVGMDQTRLFRSAEQMRAFLERAWDSLKDHTEDQPTPEKP